MNLLQLFEAESRFALYLNGRPATHHATRAEAEKFAEMVRAKMPEVKIEIRNEMHEEGVAEGYDRSNPFNVADFKRHMDSVTGSIMGRAPTNKYQVGQTVKYQMEPAQAGGSGVGKITRVSKSGDHYEIDGSKIVNHYEIKGVEQGVAEGDEEVSHGNNRDDGQDEASLFIKQLRMRNPQAKSDPGALAADYPQTQQAIINLRKSKMVKK